MGRRRKSGLNVHGVILLDKSSGLSSNGALQDVRRLFNANKAGHTGSLDPLATGVLPLCLGEATKVCSFLLNTDKRYQATLLLGVTTDSGDTEG
ncbi:MAG: tRNA pseudouridine(55) synthase TruB, partial [Methylococcales bacterium]|nr:tRNA pseudouridine(55) synthase TruB [Methylococcales bacterium]